MTQVTTEQLNDFCASIVAIRIAYAERMGYTMGPKGNVELHVTAEVGSKNARIVIRRDANHQHGSAYAFVRLEDGAILKPAGFKSPAKGVRGWINDPASVARACGPNGVAYLR